VELEWLGILVEMALEGIRASKVESLVFTLEMHWVQGQHVEMVDTQALCSQDRKRKTSDSSLPLSLTFE
jgi:hypothetical protein